MYSIGYDIGSADIKLALVNNSTAEVIDVINTNDRELDIIAKQNGWAEQDPEIWWQLVCKGTKQLISKHKLKASDIVSIGISYQMHGLVLVDENLQVLRPAIIWSDNRAVPLGKAAFQEIGEDYCLNNLLNSPGNFTISKLKWIKDNEPHNYAKIHKVMLPGDYIAMRFSNEISTTIGGLSEAVIWNFKKKSIAYEVLEYFEIATHLLPDIVETVTDSLRVSKTAAKETGLKKGTFVSYRAGDQPNNAMSLNVLEPGHFAATSGSSGVVYGVVDKLISDDQSRINSFTHVNYDQDFNRIGVLLCINGAGNQYAWLRNQIALANHSYDDMERMVASVPVGSSGLCVLPFGNGSERIFNNKNLESHIFNIEFNRHSRAHMYRASLEGVAFSFVYGIKMLQEMGLKLDEIRVANDNMFQSKVFSSTISTLLGIPIEVFDTNGAIGAARASSVAAGVYKNISDAFQNMHPAKTYNPNLNYAMCNQAYNYWLSSLEKVMGLEKDGTMKIKMLNHHVSQLSSELKMKTQKITQQGLVIDRLKSELQSINSMLEKGLSKDTSASKIILNKIKALESLTDKDNQIDALNKNLKYLNSEFSSSLLEKYPQLNFEDLKLAYLLKMKMSSKEISTILGISIRGVETRRYRLRKKLGLIRGDSISKHIEQV